MFRHLSPKVNNKDQPAVVNKPRATLGTQPVGMPTKVLHKETQEKSSNGSVKDIKNLNNFFSNKSPATTHSKKPDLPVSPMVVHSNTSTGNLRPGGPKSKNGSVFDDYYERKSKPFQAQKQPKEEVSLSGDSYQSEGYMPLKKINNPNTKSVTGNILPKQKNLVITPLLNQQEQRGGFKSPNFKSANRSQSEEQPSIKRVLSFGMKHTAANKAVESNKSPIQKKIAEPNGIKAPTSPQPKATKLADLNISGQKDKRQPPKPTVQIPVKDNKLTKKIPTVLSTGNIKTPFHHKYHLDSSNELSGELAIKKPEKPKIEPLLSQLKKEQEQHESKDHKDHKSLSFNKEEMFLNLKKRQEHHTQLCKELNTLGHSIELKLLDCDQPLSMLLIKKITESKNTAIFLAYHQKTGSLYCLKRVPLKEQLSEDKKSTINQHKIHQFCRHPHLVKGFASAIDSSYLYLFIEYMEEGTLGSQLKEQVMKHMSEQGTIKAKINESITSQISKINKIRRILFQIGGAVSYLHEKSIIHRDIKPDNIFVSHGNYKLGDFGSATYTGSLQYVGTLDYAAPEILTQHPYDNRVDIWSLGCVAYELDVGRPPFFHISQQQTKRLAVLGEYDKSLICDSELGSLIERMLVPNFKQRITCAQMLKHQFFSCLRSEQSYF